MENGEANGDAAVEEVVGTDAAEESPAVLGSDRVAANGDDAKALAPGPVCSSWRWRWGRPVAEETGWPNAAAAAAATDLLLSPLRGVPAAEEFWAEEVEVEAEADAEEAVRCVSGVVRIGGRRSVAGGAPMAGVKVRGSLGGASEERGVAVEAGAEAV
jgi:hypothetical protein